MVSVRQIDRFLEQWQMDARDLTPAAYSGADAQRAGTMARHLAAGPRLDSFGCGACLGTGSSHHWTMGRRLWRGRACRLDFRAVRGFPPAIDEAQQAELRAAVQELPAMAGSELGQLELEGGSSVCFGAVRASS